MNDDKSKGRKKSRAPKRKPSNSPTETRQISKKKLASKSENMEQTDEQLLDTAMIEIAEKVGLCVDTQAEAMTALNEHSDLLTEDRKQIRALELENKKLCKKLDDVSATLASTVERINMVERTTDTILQTVKNANIVIEGLTEVEDENCVTKVCDVFQAIDSKFSKEDITTAYRIGQRKDDNKYPRPVVVKLQDVLVKTMLMENKGKLMKNDSYKMIFLNDDLPPNMKMERRVLREISKYAHQIGYKGCRASGSKLVINGKAYRYETLHLLPDDLQLCNIKTRKIGNGLGFQGEKSFLSNFFPITFTIEGQSFNSGEQAFQFFKARTCKKDEKADKILSTSNPRDIKETGESFPSTAVWEANKEAFMRSITYHRFNQNEDIKRKLLATNDLTLYECTRNRWWGCGFRLDSPEWDNTTPPGLNKLGEILMEVRSVLRRSTWSQEVMVKSPTAILKSVNAMSQQIQGLTTPIVAGAPPMGMPDVGLAPMGDLPVINPADDDKSRMDTSEASDGDSKSEGDEELLEATDVDEESIDISASSSTSEQSDTQPAPRRDTDFSRIKVTREDGKLDLDKIRSWTIPKLNKSVTEREKGIAPPRRSQRARRTLPIPATQVDRPQASSTPHPKKINRSLTLQKVQSNLHSGKFKKN